MIISKILIAGRQAYFRRSYTKETDKLQELVETIRDKATGIDIISMAKAPVNSFDIELLRALKTSLVKAENNNSPGVILTSSLPDIFSRGYDLTQFYKIDIKKLVELWEVTEHTWLTLYTLNIPVAAAINGSSLGGGCLFALAAEYRVFVKGKHNIGLKETKLGVFTPNWCKDLYISLLGYRQAELALLRGSEFNPEEALQLKLVDELARDKAEAIEKCKNYILSFKDIPNKERTMTKLELRNDLMQSMMENKITNFNKFAEYIMSPDVQFRLQQYYKLNI